MKAIKAKNEFAGLKQETNPYKGMTEKQVAEALWKISDSIFMDSPMRKSELEWMPYYWVAEAFVAGKKLEDMTFKVMKNFVGPYSREYSPIFETHFQFFDKNGKEIHPGNWETRVPITEDMTMKIKPHMIKFIREQLKKYAPEIQV